mmetsp:Transcript_1675/g.3219  ORF Transcript_1675/g.3219 Transcript_1675/m.3219 type:complete len:340 (-) Transcript_1675:309-1328(-)
MPSASAILARTPSAMSAASAFSASEGTYSGSSRTLSTMYGERSILSKCVPTSERKECELMYLKGYDKTTGWTGVPPSNEPGKNLSIVRPLWVMPSGRRQIGARPRTKERLCSRIVARMAEVVALPACDELGSICPAASAPIVLSVSDGVSGCTRVGVRALPLATGTAKPLHALNTALKPGILVYVSRTIGRGAQKCSQKSPSSRPTWGPNTTTEADGSSSPLTVNNPGHIPNATITSRDSTKCDQSISDRRRPVISFSAPNVTILQTKVESATETTNSTSRTGRSTIRSNQRHGNSVFRQPVSGCSPEMYGWGGGSFNGVVSLVFIPGERLAGSDVIDL